LVLAVDRQFYFGARLSRGLAALVGNPDGNMSAGRPGHERGLGASVPGMLFTRTRGVMPVLYYYTGSLRSGSFSFVRWANTGKPRQDAMTA